jgi:2,4-dienoyl-CoA reductase (NADPH2)
VLKVTKKWPNMEGLFGAESSALYKPEHVAMHRLVTDAVKAAAPDCKMCMQILHAGNLASNPNAVSPSGVQSPISFCHRCWKVA